jgi:hypothetical protein
LIQRLGAAVASELVFGADPSNVGFRPDPGHSEALSMTTAVGDPLVVTFSGAVLRVDGPFQLALELP